MKAWLNNFDYWIRLLFDKSSHTLKFAETSGYGHGLVISWRLDHGRKDSSVILLLCRDEIGGFLVVVEIGLLIGDGVDIEISALSLLLRSGWVIRVHKNIMQ